MMEKSKILDSKGIEKKITRLAWQIYENNFREDEIVIIGICGRGEILALELSKVLNIFN